VPTLNVKLPAASVHKHKLLFFSATAIDVCGQRHAPAALPRERHTVPSYRRLGGPQDRSGQVKKISPSPRSDPRTVEPVASLYTDSAILASAVKLQF
jgi:hypothetical protein